jgi:drug/metabolite transporter (DMT)-like permease
MGEKMKQGNFLSIAAIVAAAVMWGLSFLSIKITVAVFPPMTLALIRFIMASMFLWGVFKWQEPNTRLAKKDFPAMLLAGVFGITLYFYFQNNGVKLITASAASIIIAIIPIMTLIADSVIFKSRLTHQKIWGVILSVIGVCLVVGLDIHWSDSGVGYLMMFGAAVAWVIYSLVTRPLFKKYSQLAIVFYQTIFGTLALSPFAVFEKTNWSLVTSVVVFNLIYLGIFCSALGYFAYMFALDKLGPNITTLFLNLVPVVAVGSSCLILGERLTYLQISGGVLVIIAVTIANWGRNHEKVISIGESC